MTFRDAVGGAGANSAGTRGDRSACVYTRDRAVGVNDTNDLVFRAGGTTELLRGWCVAFVGYWVGAEYRWSIEDRSAGAGVAVDTGRLAFADSVGVAGWVSLAVYT